MKKTIIALTLTTLFASALANADDASVNEGNNSTVEKLTAEKSTVDEIFVVTASRTPQLSTDVLSSIKVITREQIELTSASSVAELLNEINGLQMAQAGGAGQATSIFTRGTNSGHTLVIIDGQRISSATLGQVVFANISPEQIERIEVIKGPRAALWGSDAIGGVIQIFTRKLDSGELSFDLGIGNDGQQQATLSTAIGHGDGATTFTISAQSSDGYDIFESAEPDADGYNRENASLIGFQQINEQWRLNWLGKYNQGQGENDSSWGGDNENAFESNQWQLSATQNKEKWYQEVTVGQQNSEGVTYGNGKLKKDGDVFKTTRLQFNWLANYQVTDQFSTTVGVDSIEEKVKTNSNYRKNERDIDSIYTHLAFDNNSLIIEGSLRYDDIEGVGSKTTHNISIGSRFISGALVSLNYGTGFKAPSFNDLYYPVDGYNDRVLKPETSESLELLFKTEITGIQTELSVYTTKIENLIDWIPNENYDYYPVNINTAKIDGIELTLATELNGFDHQLQLNYLDAKNELTGEQLIRRAKNTASYQLSHNWDNVTLLASINYQGKREGSQWPGTVTLPSHTLVNLSAHYEIDPSWKLALKVNNLFDADYVTNNHYIGQPAQYLFTVSYRK
ncbi:MAG: TonB-dependent receptor [Alteromonadaceae bacterium]|nr:TonB-dependent receptor [Alteromonadaceae bacterium]